MTPKLNRQSGRILFAYINLKDMQSFTKVDYDILRRYYNVRPYFYRGILHGHLDSLLIAMRVFGTDVSFADFAYANAYFCVKYCNKMKKKSVVKIAGFDVAEEEVFDKTFPSDWIERLRFTLSHADRLITCSNALREKALRFAKREDIRVIPYGFDSTYFRPSGKKRDTVITIGYVRRDYLWRKGHETFVRAAKKLPNVDFVLIGRWVDNSIDYLRRISTPNVYFTGWVSDQQLLDYMQRAKVYAQVSYHEGFGLSLAESMLCECAPVVTRRGAIPEVVGDAGFYVPYNDVDATAEAIERALQDEKMRQLARKRIATEFPPERRERDLLEVVNSCIRE
ncbi:MAG: glycosyltransferase family 4 protein [Thermoplasmata archaeon]|nr:glycosyltransferase family 4 protein [Thermoplasmata archaeon]